MRKGDMEVQFRHRGLDDLTNEIFESSKRISLALIIAAILVSASLLRHAQLGLKIFGFPVLSLLGYLLGGALTIWLIINILRSPRSR
jgi:ubiquinone biosynthesis protein